MSITNEVPQGENLAGAFLPSLPLACAVLCVDCDVITISYNNACPVCGSKSLLNMAQILGGTLGPERVSPSQPRIEMIRCA
jgi:hypothetical protein